VALVTPPFHLLSGLRREGVEAFPSLQTPSQDKRGQGSYEMNLSEMRARVREDLQDTDAVNYRWTDDEVEGAIERVVMEYSLHAPIEQQDDIATTAGDTELDISSLSGLVKIESVEFPMGQSPKYYQRTECWAGHLYMEDNGDGAGARVRWLKKHTLDASSTTIPAEHEEIIVLGATGYLAMSSSAYTVDRASVAGRHATINYRSWGKERLDRYDRKLKAVSRTSKVIPHKLYTDE
jgi:hypothetical protein